MPDLTTHDQNDACISALIAAAADGKVNGMSVRGIGLPLARDPDGTLREGPLAIPLLSQELRESIDEALHELHSAVELRTAPMAAKSRLQKTSSMVSDSSLKNAIALRDYFERTAERGDAKICTYAWAYRHSFGESPPKWSQAYARKVLALAKNTPAAELPPWVKSVLIPLLLVAERDCQGTATGNLQLMIARNGNGFWDGDGTSVKRESRL